MSHPAHWCPDPTGCDDHGGRALPRVTLCARAELPPECDAESSRFLTRCVRRESRARWAQLDLFAGPADARRA